jgi:4,5:9,10-diseco-3-hydroxy-5,9,17-trioxoandrosta-1(10),2-diene-4-oate hydrolase
MQFQDRYVSVGSIKTRYWQAGSSQGSPIILLHGIGCSVLDWEQTIASLATHRRIYALDMMGSGLTEKPREDTTQSPALLDLYSISSTHKKFNVRISRASP